MSDLRTQNQGGTPAPVGDLHARGVAWTALGILIGVAICLGATAAFFDVLGRAGALPPGPLAEVAARLLPDQGPRLQPYPKQDFEEFSREQQRELQSYGWIDRRAGKVRIPLDIAMRELLEKGLPTPGTGVTRTQMLQNRAPQPSDEERP